MRPPSRTLVAFEAIRRANLKAKFDEDPSYASGARGLLKVIDGYRRQLSAA